MGSPIEQRSISSYLSTSESVQDEVLPEIAMLPPEVLFSIFQYLPFSALNAASLVCKQWRILADHHNFHDRVAAETKLGPAVFHYFTPYVDKGEVTWQEVTKWTAPSFLHFLDTIRMSLLEMNFLGTDSDQFGNFLITDVSPWLVVGSWSFAIEEECHGIKIENAGKGFQVLSVPDVVFTHLAHEGNFLFALSWNGRIYQIDYQKCQIIQIIETSLSVDPNVFIAEHLDDGTLSEYDTVVWDVDNTFSVCNGKILLFYKYTFVDVIDYRKPEAERMRIFKHEKKGVLMTPFLYGNQVCMIKQGQDLGESVEILQYDLESEIFLSSFFPRGINTGPTALVQEGNQFYCAFEDGSLALGRIGSYGALEQTERLASFSSEILAIGLLKDFFVFLNRPLDSVSFVNRHTFEETKIMGNAEELMQKTLEAVLAIIKKSREQHEKV